MKNNNNATQKAKKYLAKYRLILVAVLIPIALITVIITVTIFYFAYYWHWILFLLLMFVCVRLIRYTKGRLAKKYILSVLFQKLDVDTYREMIRLGRIDNVSASYQLAGEYYGGYYANVVGICKKKMAEPKLEKKISYYYLAYLGNVYFQVGDDEKLRVVHERYERVLADESPNVRKKYRSLTSGMEFYGSYLKRDIPACLEFVERGIPNDEIFKYRNIFFRARIALLQGNIEEARGYFESLAQTVPQLCYGKVAVLTLEKLDSVGEPQEPFDLTEEMGLCDTEREVTLYNKRFYKTRIVISLVMIAIGLLGLIFINPISDAISDGIYNKRMKEYYENIRVLVEEDYDGVEVLDAFNLMDGEDIVDSMFICNTDEEIVIGCTYVYDGEKEIYYKKLSDVSKDWLFRDSIIYCGFPSFTSHDTTIKGNYYRLEKDIPEEYIHLSTFEIDGENVYFAITEVIR